jgi:hypothetical protein
MWVGLTMWEDTSFFNRPILDDTESATLTAINKYINETAAIQKAKFGSSFSDS